MTTFANALKEEVRRLARKEIKAQTSRTSRAVAQYRREIARLKRQLRDQDKKLSYVTKQVQRSGTAPSAAKEVDSSTRFSSRSVRSQRRRSGLSAADYAKLVGVSPLTIYHWESGKSRPRQQQFAALVALRGLGKREAQAKLAELGATSGRRRARRGRK
jgi:DNA-binding transcriptional regulator YiaG